METRNVDMPDPAVAAAGVELPSAPPRIARPVPAVPSAIIPPIPSPNERTEHRLSDRKRKVEPARSLTPIEDVLLRRLTTIQEGDNVLLRLPSDSIKAVVASREGTVKLGKFGVFPCSELLGLHYDITYEIVSSNAEASSSRTKDDADTHEDTEPRFGQIKGKKKRKQKGSGRNAVHSDDEPASRSVLRPLKRPPIVEAVIDDIAETNEFIDDTEDAKGASLTQDEIEDMRNQGASPEELIRRQMERHDRFGLKTDFSKEKWRKRKEKKFYQTVHPLAPSSSNIVNHYATRSPQSILFLREDTLSQLLTYSNIRPGGRYLVVDDTGGLVTASILDRMGAEGRILVFTENDSPPAWGVLGVMNFGERELSCIKWMNWMEADEEYVKPPPPDEDEMPAVAVQKTIARNRRHNIQVGELNAIRDELHLGSWDGLIVATELSPISVLARLTPYVTGSGTICVYSPYQQVLAELLQYSKRDLNYLNSTLSESWSRTYQVLPGRSHPLMTTSATGGYLFTALRVHPSKYEPQSHQRHVRRQKKDKPEDGL